MENMMGGVITTMIQVVAILGGIGGFVSANIISTEVGAFAVIMILVLIICFGNFSHKIEIEFKDISNRLTNLEGRKNDLTESHSPIKLNEKGKNVLTESGGFDIADNKRNRSKILRLILNKPKPTNAYDAQEKTINIILGLEDDPMFVPLKKYAFKQGLDIRDILYALAIYFRKYTLKELDFKEKDCDK